MGHVNATFDSLFSAWKQCAIKSRFENTTQIRFKKNGQENVSARWTYGYSRPEAAGAEES